MHLETDKNQMVSSSKKVGYKTSWKKHDKAYHKKKLDFQMWKKHID